MAIIGETPQEREIRETNESYRSRLSQRDGVFYDEFMCPIPCEYIPKVKVTPEKEKEIEDSIKFIKEMRGEMAAKRSKQLHKYYIPAGGRQDDRQT